MDPPPFQEASRCDVCKCSFSTFRRRHHCRCCGRTLCAEHSSNQMALPQFGIHSNVRVCVDCFNDGSRLNKDALPAGVATSIAVNSVVDSISSLDIGKVPDVKPDVIVAQSPQGISDCKCGMPLCICEVPEPQSDPVLAQSSNIRPKPSLPSTKIKKPGPSTKSGGSTSNGRPTSSVFNQGQAISSSVDLSSGNYENTGEGLREAIKNGDVSAAKKLLCQGVDANYCDRQGSSLLHLAAVFNQTDIVFALIDHGASLSHKNSLGETPLDCAPAALQYKIKKRMEEDVKSGP